MASVVLLQLALAGGVLLASSELQKKVEAFSGQAAFVDARLLLPACARPEFAWGPGERSVMVHCGAPEWRVFVPVGEAAASPAAATAATTGAAAAAVPAAVPGALPPAVRRGDRVSLEVGGEGFVIAMDTIAEADARDGRVAVRPIAGGRRLYGSIAADGHVWLRPLNTVVNSR